MAIAPWIQRHIDNNLDITTGQPISYRFITATTIEPTEPTPAVAKYSHTWESLSLLAQTQAVRSVQQQFSSANRNVSDIAAIEIAKSDYTPAQMPVKATETDTDRVFNLTSQCQALNAKEEADRQVVRAAVEEGAKYPLPQRTGTSWLY